MTKKLIPNKRILNNLIFWLAGSTLLGLFLPLSVSATDGPVGVVYRGHIQDLGDYPLGRQTRDHRHQWSEQAD